MGRRWLKLPALPWQKSTTARGFFVGTYQPCSRVPSADWNQASSNGRLF